MRSVSRMLYVEFTLAQTLEHFLAGHQRAFEFFQAVPAGVMVDNAKTAVRQHPPLGEPVFNPRYLDFARHYGFEIKACGVRKPHEKGRVENAVGYVQKGFLRGMVIEPFAALNPAVHHWLETVANVRVHGQTRQRPVDLLLKEKPLLKPLGLRPYDVGSVRLVRATSRLVEGETLRRRDHATERRVREARFPVIKTLDTFDWSWPKKINQPQIQDLFRLGFLEQKANVISLGGVGLGKTHLASALTYAACLAGHTALFASAIDLVNSLLAAQAVHRLKAELKRYLSPKILCLDEVGYLPIDKHGADLLFQVISQRYECGSIILTTNKAFKSWPAIFNNDATLASAVLDRLLHHAETVIIEGKSFRMKGQTET